jgi:hypothetical protein
MENNYFEKLYKIDVRDKAKQKNNLSYLSWAACWAEVKKVYPTAEYTVYENEIGRPWFDDGKTGWVKTGVIINEIEHIEYLPIMDFKNKSIGAENITSTDANKAVQRSLTKACARHGLGLYIYEGEDLPEETKQLEKLQAECLDLIKVKCKLGEGATAKVAELCKAADENANGDPKLMQSVETLETLKKRLLGVRK